MKSTPAKQKKLQHPKVYTIFTPNELVRAKKLDMTLMEIRVYNEVLNNNHIKEPDRLVYPVPYKYVFNVADTQNKMHNIRRISKNLQRRIFYFNQNFMLQYFGENADVSMVPFPKITYHEDHFEVELYKDFKKILTLIKSGDFTKGDIETLRLFNHEISNSFYWLIRQRQQWKGTWEVELKELKESLGLYGKYEVYSNFKTKVLDVCKEEFRDTWVEFEYEPIRKGQGAPVKALLFKFKHGPGEGDAPAGEIYSWEEKLLALGVAPEKVKELRHRVRAGSRDEEKNVDWDQEYVKFSIEAATNQLKDIKKDKNKKPVKNVGGWVYSGLIDGRWNEYVNVRREKIRNEVQSSLDFGSMAAPIPVRELASTTKNAIATLNGKDRVVQSKEDLDGWKELYEAAAKSPAYAGKTFEDFLEQNHVEKEGNVWVKYY